MSEPSDKTHVPLQVVPTVAGWFTDPSFAPDSGAPRLLGSKCRACGTWFFPRERTACRNPACGSADLEEARLSPTGTLWSYTNAGYQPPDPFVPAKLPFEPFALAAVELEAEKLCVLGMVPARFSCADLKVGMRMELVVETLYETAAERVVTWKWQPEGRRNP